MSGNRMGKKRGSMCVISREAMDKDGVSLCVCEKETGGGVSAGIGLSFYDMIGCVRKR